MSRRRSRTIILQILYREEFHSNDFDTNQDRQFFFKNLDNLDIEFIFSYLTRLKNRKACLDKTIAKYTKNWKIDRMSLVDLNIMRLAIFEILFCPEIPDKVALNEALELARQFGEKDSISFVNGILDQVVKR